MSVPSHGFDRVISADSHVMEPRDLWKRLLFQRFGEHTPRIISDDRFPGEIVFYTGGQRLRIKASDASAQRIGFEEAGYRPEIRVEFQKQAGIESEVLHATLMLLIMQAPQLNVVRAAAQVFNDWLAEFCSHDQRRLLGVAMVPVDDPEWARRELERVTRKGLRGMMVHLLPPPGCAPFRDPIYDPLWAAAQDLDVPVTLHIATGRVADPLHFETKAEQSQAPARLLDLFYEVMGVLANDFIFGGVLDRFPRLKLVCSEFEVSWIPSFMWRLNQIQEDMGLRLQLPRLAMRASDYVATRMWHGVIDDPLGVDAIARVGVDRILWGSDFPHVRSIGLDAQSRLAQIFSGLDVADREKVLFRNVSTVYRI